MCNSLIMMTTTSSNPVIVDGVIPLTTISRRRGQAVNSGSNSILLGRAGYYKVNATFTFTGQTVGDVVIQAQKNGFDIVGMTASTTITTATTETRSLTITGIVRVFCNEDLATLTFINTGVAITTTNVEVDVEYLG